MNPFASLLFRLAHLVAPKPDKLWIGDMRLEAPFVPNKLRFAFAALGLAFKFRWAAMRLNRPASLAFASATLAAVATLLVVPNLLREPTTDAAMSPLPNASYQEAQGIAAERGYSAEAQVGVEAGVDATTTSAGTVEPMTQATTAQSSTAQSPAVPASPALVPSAEATILPETNQVPVEGQVQEGFARISPEQDVAPASDMATSVSEAAMTEPSLEEATVEEPLAQAPLAAPPAAITPEAVPTERTTAEAESSAGESAEANEQAITDTVAIPTDTNADTDPAQSVVATLPAPATPSVDTEVISTQVRNESVLIVVRADALLTLYRNTDFAGAPRAHRYVTEGDTFTANVPFSLYTDNAAAIEVTVDAESYNLGEENEEQFRIFSKP
jgi:hypothetical protein